MAKVKSSSKVTTVDMTAMCDVAFLLLTFFILTATSRQPEPLPVDTPNSTVQTKLPDSDLATITIGDNGKVFFGVAGREIRIRTLEQMSDKYGIDFSEEDKQKFALIDNFGVPIGALKQIIDMKPADRNKTNVQPGIPKDSTDNQLAHGMRFESLETLDIDEKELTIAIKGDANEQYPEIKRVMDILQDQKVNTFNLVTGLRSENF